MRPTFYRHRRSLLFASLLLAPLSVGCGQNEEIRSYTVPKDAHSHPQPAARLAEAGEPTDRMLGAILPAGNQAWFFKVVGPLAAVDARSAELAEFLASIRLSDEGRATWELPADWKEDEGTGLRAATIWVPTDQQPLELTVTVLSWRGTPQEVLNNVNRWRDQMRLPQVGHTELADFTREIEVGDQTMTVVDLRGRFDAESAMPPFAGGAGSRPAADADDLPPGHPPIRRESRPHGTADATADIPQFTAPESWREIPAEGFRKAAFAITDDERAAEVTVFDFPVGAGPMITEPLPNVNRWRQEIRLQQITEEELDKYTDQLEIDQHEATFARLIPDPAKPEESHTEEATLAAMVAVDGRIWFFKLRGDRDLVRGQQDNFRSFLKSVRFSADEGASDGDR